MDRLSKALKEHGSAVDAVLSEAFEEWDISQSMRLLAIMARELAQSEKDRRTAVEPKR